MTTHFQHQTAHPRHLRLGALLATVAVLGGCASFSPDGGFGSVQQTAKNRLGKDLVIVKSGADQDAIARRVGELLTKPLMAGDAVRSRC